MNDYADYIIRNGRFYTEESHNPQAEVVAIKGEKFIFVGKQRDFQEEEYKGPDTKLIDLGGKAVIPGMIDGHVHPEGIATTGWRYALPDTDDVEELLGYVKEYCDAHPPEEVPFVFASSYPVEMFDEKGPKKELLDKYVSDRPVKIEDFTGHGCWYNSKALELMGITAEVPETGEAPFFIRDEKNEPTGWVREPIPLNPKEEALFDKIGWHPPKQATEENVMPFLQFLNEHGIICILDGITEGENGMKLFYDLDMQGKLNMYYEGTCQLLSLDGLDECIRTIREWQKKYTSKHVGIHTVKFFLDGTNEIGNSASLEPHYNDPEGKNYGEMNMSREELTELLLRLNEEKLDLHIHVVGDRGFRTACDAYEEALEQTKKAGKEWNIYMELAHCELVHPDDMKRPAELGIIINWSCHWAGGYFGEAAIDYLGQARWNTMYDFTEMIRSGAVVTFSSDVLTSGEAYRANPFLGMEISATRVDPDLPLDGNKYPGSVRPPEKAKLTVEEMVKGYTIDGAVPFRFQDKMGSIEVGKQANLVVLNDDIFTIEPDRLHQVEALMVMFEGNIICNKM